MVNTNDKINIESIEKVILFYTEDIEISSLEWSKDKKTLLYHYKASGEHHMITPKLAHNVIESSNKDVLTFQGFYTEKECLKFMNIYNKNKDLLNQL